MLPLLLTNQSSMNAGSSNNLCKCILLNRVTFCNVCVCVCGGVCMKRVLCRRHLCGRHDADGTTDLGESSLFVFETLREASVGVAVRRRHCWVRAPLAVTYGHRYDLAFHYGHMIFHKLPRRKQKRKQNIDSFTTHHHQV